MSISIPAKNSLVENGKSNNEMTRALEETPEPHSESIPHNNNAQTNTAINSSVQYPKMTTTRTTTTIPTHHDHDGQFSMVDGAVEERCMIDNQVVDKLKRHHDATQLAAAAQNNNDVERENGYDYDFNYSEYDTGAKQAPMDHIIRQQQQHEQQQVMEEDENEANEHWEYTPREQFVEEPSTEDGSSKMSRNSRRQCKPWLQYLMVILAIVAVACIVPIYFLTANSGENDVNSNNSPNHQTASNATATISNNNNNVNDTDASKTQTSSTTTKMPTDTPEKEEEETPTEEVVEPPPLTTTTTLTSTLVSELAPMNDNCDGALGPLMVGSRSFETTLGAQDDYVVCDKNSNEIDSMTTIVAITGVWYKVIGTGQNLAVSTSCNERETNFDAQMWIFSGESCDELYCVNATTYDCSLTVWPSIKDQEYYILVSHVWENDVAAANDAGNFVLLVENGLDYYEQNYCDSDNFSEDTYENITLEVSFECDPPPGFADCEDMPVEAFSPQAIGQQCAGTAIEMAFVFMGGSCQMSFNRQLTNDHFACTDYQTGPGFLEDTDTEVYIIVTDTDNPTTIYFQGYVGVGEQFYLKAPQDGSSNGLGENHTVHIYNSSDTTASNLIRFIQFHGACTNGDLALCDSFGGLYFDEWINAEQGLLVCHFDMYSYRAVLTTTIDISVPSNYVLSLTDKSVHDIITGLVVIADFEPLHIDLTSMVSKRSKIPPSKASLPYDPLDPNYSLNARTNNIGEQSLVEHYTVNFSSAIDIQERREYNVFSSLLINNKFGLECRKHKFHTYVTGAKISYPANDQCIDANVLPLNTLINSSTILATIDMIHDDCGNHADFIDTHRDGDDNGGPSYSLNLSPGIWYTVYGTGNRMYASTCNTDEHLQRPESLFDTQLSIFAGDSCDTLLCVSTNNDACGLQSFVTWSSTLNQVYHILVHGNLGSSGDFTLQVGDLEL